MKTIKVKIYKFKELTNEAKNYVIQKYRNQGNNEMQFCYDEALQTVKKFNDLFNIKSGSYSWLDCSLSHIDDNIINLTGLRLRTYFINNFWSDIYKGKYYSLWSKKDFKDNKNLGIYCGILKKRYSKVLFVKDCPLTGVCYDHSILFPIYELIDNYKAKESYYSSVNFEDIINDCFSELKKDLESEEIYRDSKEFITEELINQDCNYFDNGKEFI